MEVLKNLPDAVIVVETDNRISWVNNKAARMFHCFERDLIELPLEEILVEGSDIIRESFYKHKSIVTAAITLDNEEFFVEISARKYEDQYLVTLRDVTKLTNIYSDIEQNGKFTKEKNLMICKLANDFKTPLHSMIGFSQALKDGVCGDVNEKQTKYLNIINKNAKDLSYFMEKFIEFSYAESSLFKTNAKIFDCLVALQSVIREFDDEISNKKLVLDFKSYELEKKIIYCDETVFKSIVRNLLKAAVSATSAGFVSVRISNPDLEEVKESNAFLYRDLHKTSYIKIEIKDTGVGISESELKTIYDPYMLLDSANKKGISRAIVFATIRTMVKKLKGAINITSKVMKGSDYTVILPVEKDKEFDYE
ncbi:PAS domain-containing protein [bacterium]|nr:PAS domain-containing protein [bacterium]